MKQKPRTNRPKK